MSELDVWLEKIATFHPKAIDLGLERMHYVAEKFELTRFSCPVITITGTNGKGSTVALLRGILRAAGYRVGSYTFPHLHVFNERILFNEQMVSNEALLDAFIRIDQVRQSLPQSNSLTYFEFTTLAALWLFKQDNLDVLLLEVGLGGRLDAVNIVANDIGIITSVDLDHMEWLGTDREMIGYEKAGIFKAGKPAICGDLDIPASVTTYAQQVAAPLYYCNFEPHRARLHPDNTTIESDEKRYYYTIHSHSWDWHSHSANLLQLPLPNLLVQNAATALMAIVLLAKQMIIPREAIEEGLVKANVTARLQQLPGQPAVLLDVAHNPAAMRILAQHLQTHPCLGKTRIVIGMLADKDIANSLAALYQWVDNWYLATLSAPRGADSEQLAQVLADLQVDGKTIRQFSDPGQAFSAAKSHCAPDDRIIVCGSFYTVSEVSFLLGICNNNAFSES